MGSSPIVSTTRVHVDPERAASAVFGAVILTGLHEIVLHGRLDPAAVLDDVSTVVLDGLADGAGHPRSDP